MEEGLGYKMWQGHGCRIWQVIGAGMELNYTPAMDA